MDSKQVELLAPGGDIEAIKAAIVAGADAIYCGLNSFNARNRATNLSIEQLHSVLRLAHQYQCKIFLTLNIIILQCELKALFNLLNQLVNSKIDGVIVQDLGLLYLLKKYFPRLDVHASTQLTTHNRGQIEFLNKLGVSRINLCRELSITEIKQINQLAHQYDIQSEVFVHGSLCIGFSGLCYATSVTEGNSGNRGRCSQACRDQYLPSTASKAFPLNLKDNCAYFELEALVDAGVDSLKIEGRIKGDHYVYTVVNTWRQQVDSFYCNGILLTDDSDLHRVFNRDFTDGYLQGHLSQSMFIDNPRDHSVNAAIIKAQAETITQINQVKDRLTSEKDRLGDELRAKTALLNMEKPQLIIKFKGKLEQQLTITVKVIKDNPHGVTTDSYSVTSEGFLTQAVNAGLTQAELIKRFKGFDNFDYQLLDYDFTEFDNADVNVSLPYKQLTLLKNQLAYWLNDSIALLPAVEVPKLTHYAKVNEMTELVVLIDKPQDIETLYGLNITLYFKLPESFLGGLDKWIALFTQHSYLTPWFPAILIGQDFDQALEFLRQVKPKQIISNNTGISEYAAKAGIAWIAGPYLNTSNSYAMLAMQQTANASGAFISNELNKLQIKQIARPQGFKIFYSIYHPILLMSSRQCFFQQTTGCKKQQMTKGCLAKCEKHTEIVNLKGMAFNISKKKGSYSALYNQTAFCNLDIIKDLPDHFDGLMMDLTSVTANDDVDKPQLVTLFQQYIAGDYGCESQIKQAVSNVTHAQYVRGL